MKLEKLRDRLLGLVLDECQTIPKEFVQANWGHLKYCVDDSLRRYNKYLISKSPSRLYLFLQLLLSIAVFILSFKYLKLDTFGSLALTGFAILNADLFYYRDFQKLVHSIYVRFNYKVKNYCILRDRFGYSLVIIANDPDDFKKVLVMSAIKPKKNINYENPKMYLVHSSSLCSTILDYKTGKNTLTFNELKQDIYTNISQEYLKFRIIQGFDTF